MIISLQKPNNEIQQDIVVYINGQDTNISKEEIKKINEVLYKYAQYDISFKLEKCDNSYMQVFISIFQKLLDKVSISMEPSSADSSILFSKIISQSHKPFNLVIKKEEDYINFIRPLIGKFNMTVDISIILKYFDEIKQNPHVNQIIVSTNNMRKLGKQEIDRIKELNNVIGVKFDWENIKGEHSRHIVSIDEYTSILSQLQKYSKIANRGKNQLEKFLIAYYLIGKNVKYEFDDDGESSRNQNDDSIKGAVINKRAVCEGYSESLSQLLNLLEINNKCVTGKSTGKLKASKHVWNQVLIEGKWYNCDITNDSANINDNRKFDFCLVSDKDFFLYKALSSNAERCLETMALDEIENER